MTLDSDIKKFEKEINELESKINTDAKKQIKKEIKSNKNKIEDEIIKIEKFITEKNIELNKLNKEKEDLLKEKEKKESIKKISNTIYNKNLNLINTIYNNIKKRGKTIDEKKLINKYDSYEAIEEIYLKDSSSTSDFTSKNIYRRIFIILNYYNKAYDNKSKDIQKLKNELTNLKNNKNSKKIKKYIFDMYNEIKENLENISTSIKEEKSKLSINSKSESNKDLKDKFNNEFNSIIIISKQYEFVIDSKNYKKMNNKLLNYYNKNYNFIKIINDIKNNKNNKNTSGNTNNKNTSGNTNNKKINRIKVNANSNKKITNELSNYFSANDLFIDKLNPIFSKDFKDENVLSFFKQYKEFYNILKNKKIQLLLNKINTGMIKYNNSSDDFINGIKTKIEYYNKIKISAEPSKNEFKDKKGKYTQVLPYTDIMFLYFIDLLIIIDYLTFYYE